MATPQRPPIDVLFVCTANLCRSVTAAEFARRQLQERTTGKVRWSIESAGTNVQPDQRLPPRIDSTMRELGIPRRSQPRPLTEADVRSARLILTAERHHRARVVERYPFAVRSTFTLLQFARLVTAGRDATGAGPTPDVDGLLTLARLGRAQVQPTEDATIDIVDPVTEGSASAMLRCADLIAGAVDEIIH